MLGALAAGSALLATVVLPLQSVPAMTETPIAHAAAVDYFLKLDGIDGESTEKGHENEIDVESWSWGESQPGVSQPARGGGGGAGKVSMQDFHFNMNYNKASPKLFLAAATGEHIKKATLVARKSGGDRQEYYKLTLENILVTSLQDNGDATGITESFSLNFEKIQMEYRPQRADGSLDAAVKAGYDLKANKKV